MHRLNSKNIAMKIFIFSLSISILLTTALVTISYYLTEELTFDLVHDNSSKNIRAHGESVGHWIDKQITVMETYASSPTIRSMNWDQIEPYLRNEVLKGKGPYEQFFLADPSGNYHTTGKRDAGNLKDRDYFHKVMAGNSVFTQPLLSKTLGRFTYIIAIPIWGEKQEVIGLLGASIDFSTLKAYVDSFRVNHKSSYSYIVDQKGYVIAHPNTDYITKLNITIPSKVIPPELARNAWQVIQNEEGCIDYTFKDVKTYAYYKKIPHTDGWTLVTRVPFDYLYEPIKAKNRRLFIIGSIATMFIGFFSLFIGMLVSKPLVHLKKTLEENTSLLEKTLRHDQFKTEFFSNISHELKTPLNIIFGNIQLMELASNQKQDSPSYFKSTKYLSVMKQNCYRLMRLIDNLIDITRIDAGYIKLNLENHNIVEIVEEITLSTVEYIENKGKMIEFDTDTEEKMMACDPDKIERIMLNLISNAVKFTNLGDLIQVNVFDHNERVLICVKDSGIGIPEEKQQQIFERFAQVDSSLNKNQEGSGIGLSLVKSLVEMHGGTISVESQVGKGTEFVISLPVQHVHSDDNTMDGALTSKQNKVERIHIEFSDIYS
ncbi:signal transduction histidine kinase [Anaerosolibacter carboniphilus]|uniref:histidine kinase n=2 Tax=Anaerosolibacter carboniphilus TaxID=1417629 RepID=A0A841L0P3_9FIRM|nr:signal transduction histidine kinase [Anaerosolibacter carboniphilus]